MSIVGIEIPEQLKPFVDGHVARRGYRDIAEYFLSLAEADRLRDIRAELEGALLESVHEKSVPMGAADWAQLRREGIEILRKPASI